MTTSEQGLPTRREGSTFASVVLLVVGAVDAAGYSIIAPVTRAIARLAAVPVLILAIRIPRATRPRVGRNR